MKIKATVARNNKTVGELFLVAKKYYQTNITELKETEAKKRKKLANKIIKLKKQVYLREAKKAKANTYNELYKLLIKAKETYKKSLKNARFDCIQLVESICKQIIGDEFLSNPKFISNRVKEEIAKLENKQFTILANPLETNDLKKEINTDYLSDENIPRGIAIIKTESGSIEINWREQLKEIVKRLKEENA